MGCDDSISLQVIEKVKPDEIYNLAQSHVAAFEVPEYTANADALAH